MTVPRKPGPRRTRPTQADIAERLGITAVAVSLALNDRPGVSEDLRAEVHRVADQIGYSPNYAARAMRTNRSWAMGVIYRNLHNPAFLSLIEGFDDACAARGYTVMVGSSRFDPARELALIESFASRGIDGLAVMAVDPVSATEAWKRFGDKPLALLASPPAGEGHGLFTARSDEGEALRRSVCLLAEHGHRRVALLTGRPSHPAPSGRSEDFVRHAKDHGMDPVLLPAGWEQAEVRAAIVAHLNSPDRVTAIIANSDWLAMSVYRAAEDCGLTIPSDLSVIGHDDIATAELLNPALTTFKVDHFAMGARAAGQLMGMVGGEPLAVSDLVLPVTLVRRKSVAAPPG
jgi:DNA-binding LacI/PurR family transcriptional regulator